MFPRYKAETPTNWNTSVRMRNFLENTNTLFLGKYEALKHVKDTIASLEDAEARIEVEKKKKYDEIKSLKA